MRLFALACLITLATCLGYSRYLDSDADQTQCYQGPAQYVSYTRETDDAGNVLRRTLVCSVNGYQIAFPADSDWIQDTAASLRPGEEVAIYYVLPAVYSDSGTSIGPPVLRDFRSTRRTSDATLALNLAPP